MKPWHWLAGVSLAFVLSSPAATQEVTQAAPASDNTPSTKPLEQARPTPPGMVRLPTMTPVDIEITAELSSKTSKIDDLFAIKLRHPIVIDGKEVVPVGTPGQGQVVHAKKAAWGGRAGELVVTVRYLEFQGARIPLRRFRMGDSAVGQERLTEAFVATEVIPLAGFLVNGGEKTILVGTHANAIVAADTDVSGGAEGSLPTATPTTPSTPIATPTNTHDQ